MTYFDLDLDRERVEGNDQARCDRNPLPDRTMGATDAAFRQLPQFANPEYLEGYVAKLKDLPTDTEGRIVYSRCSAQHFAWGYADTHEQFRASDEF